jgi:hypothetical protein
MRKGRRYVLVVEVPLWADEADGVRRLRALLKRLCRGYQIHCVKAEPIDEPQPPTPDGEYCYPIANPVPPPLVTTK